MKDHKMPNKTLLAVALLAALGTSACSKHMPGQMSDSQAADAPKQSASLGDAIDDTAITAKVKGRLASDARTQTASIEVETNNGVVTLSGTANTADQKDAAEQLARTVENVKGVDDQIKAPSTMDSLAHKADSVADAAGNKLDQAGDAINDSWITTKVKADLASDKQIKNAEIDVSTDNGVVKLSGSVPSATARDHATDVAKQVHGVKRVDDSALTVASK